MKLHTAIEINGLFFLSKEDLKKKMEIEREEFGYLVSVVWERWGGEFARRKENLQREKMACI